MSKFELVQQTFLAKNLVKSLRISALDKVIYICTTKEHFYRAQQNLSLQHKIGWRPAEKNLPLFQHVSSNAKISMVPWLVQIRIFTFLSNRRLIFCQVIQECLSPSDQQLVAGGHFCSPSPSFFSRKKISLAVSFFRSICQHFFNIFLERKKRFFFSFFKIDLE
jgi:hypothetical protein